MRFFLVFVCLLIGKSSFGQTDFEYLGLITLQDSSLISYKIAFTEDNGIIQGYSITDLTGEHETKSIISGTFNKKDKKLIFRESGIVYTKSPITQNDFCYIHFNGSLAKLNNRRKISGEFQGKYSDGSVCINGTIDMKSLVKIEKRATKLDKTIDNSFFVAKEKRDQVNLLRTLDTINSNYIKANEVVQVFTKDSSMKLTIVDIGQNDGDKISIFLNDKPLLEDKLVTTEPTVFTIPVDDNPVRIKILATSTGSIGANTVQLDLNDSRNSIVSITNMNKNESAEFVLIKQQ